MLLQEIFNDVYPYEWTSINNAKFFMKDSTFYSVTFIDFGDGKAEVMFTYTDENWNRTIDITNKKDSFKVFSTVIAITKDYISKHNNITALQFTAKSSETSRIRLYTKLCQKLSNGDCQIGDFGGTEVFFKIDLKGQTR